MILVGGIVHKRGSDCFETNNSLRRGRFTAFMSQKKCPGQDGPRHFIERTWRLFRCGSRGSGSRRRIALHDTALEAPAVFRLYQLVFVDTSAEDGLRFDADVPQHQVNPTVCAFCSADEFEVAVPMTSSRTTHSFPGVVYETD